MKKRLKFIAFWAVAIITFSSFAVLLLMEANGYKFNTKSLKIQKTGLILVEADPEPVVLHFAGKTKILIMQERLTKLLPGFYEVEITKDNYQTWNKKVHLDAGQAIDLTKILLFLNNPKPQEITDPSYHEKITKTYKDQSKDLLIKENEIWSEEKFVTRFTDKVEAAIRINRTNQIIFQVGQEIRVIDVDGSNNLLLVKLENSTPTPLMYSAKKLYYLDGEKIFQTVIR